MKNNQKNKNRNYYLNLFYLISLIVIALGIITFTVIMIIKPFDYKELNDLKQVDINNYLEQEPKKSEADYYYVLVYKNNDIESNMIEEVVLEYANFTRKNKEAAFIYGLQCNEDNQSKIAQLLGESFNENTDYPALIKVSSGEGKVEQKTVSSINKTLQDLYYGK